MTYTIENYEQDKRITIYVFNKNFKGHYLKDDLIQTAIIALWRLRQKRNYNDYVNCACKTALNHMIDFLRKESRRFADSLFDSVGGENDVQLIDILVSEQPTAQDIYEYRELVKRIFSLPMLVSNRNRKIIALHLKHYAQGEIAERVGVSRQYVNRTVRFFREAVRQILGE